VFQETGRVGRCEHQPEREDRRKDDCVRQEMVAPVDRGEDDEHRAENRAHERSAAHPEHDEAGSDEGCARADCCESCSTLG